MPPYYGFQEPRKSFRTLVAEQIMSCLSGAVSNQEEGKKGSNVLVVDDFALGCLNACVGQAELFKAGFMTVCPFETKKQLEKGLRRRKYPSLDVLYFIRPKKTNLQRILDDYKQEVKDEKKDVFERLFPCIFSGLPELEAEPPMYADCRLVVLPGVQQKNGAANWQLAEEFLLNQVQSRGAELERMSKCFKFDHNMKECPVEFAAYESSLFSLELPDTVSTVYTHPLSGGGLEGAELEEVRERVFDHLDTVANRLMTACIALNEMPFVRYTHSTRGISEVVARSLVKQLKQYRESHPTYRPWGDPRTYDEDISGTGARVLRSNEPPESAIVIVVDRVDDLAAALMHDVSYESLVVDLLDHVPATPYVHTYTKSGNTVEKDVLLDESDPVWRNLRHEDMGTVIDSVDEGARNANARAERRKGLDPHDIHDMRELMSVLTGDEKLVDDKFAQHYRMKNQIVEMFERRSCHEVVTFEQVLLTSCDSEGSHVSSKKLESMLRDLLRNDRVTIDDQARVLSMYILCAKSLDQKTRTELYNMSKAGKKEQKALNNLVDLHVPINRGPSEARSDSAPFLDDDTLKRNKKIAADSRKLCRYVTKVEDVVKNALDGSLPEGAYPWVKAPPKKGDSVPIDSTKLSASMAMHGAHGEVVNKYTAAAMSAGQSVDLATVKSKATKKSKFTRMDGNGDSAGAGGAGGGAVGGGSAESKEADIMAKYMEPIKPRYYDGGRIILFVVGGVSLPEIAALTRLSKETNREIIVGGTSIMTGKDLLEQMELTDPSMDDSMGPGGFDGAGIGDVKLDDF